jgi:hypothetical protein
MALWAFCDNRIAAPVHCEDTDAAGRSWRGYGVELWEFKTDGLIRGREACINELPTDAREGRIRRSRTERTGTQIFRASLDVAELCAFLSSKIDRECRVVSQGWASPLEVLPFLACLRTDNYDGLLELRQLAAFVEVASGLHCGRAAERPHMGRPSLSDLVRRLEREMGTPLLSRTTRGVTWTSAGHELRQRR